MAASIGIKRVYDHPSAGDGLRVLVDRIWPRGLSKDAAALDHWVKDVAPSTALRQWFGHKPERWSEFQRRYRAELDGNPAVAEMRALTKRGHVTLLYGARDTVHNQAIALAGYLRKPARKKG